jgi:High potential iron-sulfur protein
MGKAITAFLTAVERDTKADKGCGARNVSRRLALLAAPMVLALPFGRARGAEKMSKQAAQYQDTPKGIAMCATCSLFLEPRSCKVVEGDVSPNGWCNAYAMAD